MVYNLFVTYDAHVAIQLRTQEFTGVHVYALQSHGLESDGRAQCLLNLSQLLYQSRYCQSLGAIWHSLHCLWMAWLLLAVGAIQTFAAGWWAIAVIQGNSSSAGGPPPPPLWNATVPQHLDGALSHDLVKVYSPTKMVPWAMKFGLRAELSVHLLIV